jgi:predicted chitinase
MAVISAGGAISALLLGGLMGLIGQGARTAVGLHKRSVALASTQAGEQDLFDAARLLIGLMIGFIAGVIGAIALGIEKLTNFDTGSTTLLIGLATAGYAGTDLIEGFIARFSVDTPPPAGDGTRQSSDSSTTTTTTQAPPPPPPPPADILGKVTPQMVKGIFPAATPLANIVAHLPHVVAGLRWAGLTDRAMLLMALATIRAETEGFAPIDEGTSKYNTDKAPFDRYEPGTPAGDRLGNKEAGDGAQFKGRGYIQLTGRANYETIEPQIGAAISTHPELANEPAIAGRILAQFLKNHEARIRSALAAADLATARKAVNGGAHRLEQFEDTYQRGDKALPA